MKVRSRSRSRVLVVDRSSKIGRMLLILATNVETVLPGRGLVWHLELKVYFILGWHRVRVQQRQSFAVGFITTVVVAVEVPIRKMRVGVGSGHRECYWPRIVVKMEIERRDVKTNWI